jgi:hypothetical protein
MKFVDRIRSGDLSDDELSECLDYSSFAVIYFSLEKIVQKHLTNPVIKAKLIKVARRLSNDIDDKAFGMIKVGHLAMDAQRKLGFLEDFHRSYDQLPFIEQWAVDSLDEEISKRNAQDRERLKNTRLDYSGVEIFSKGLRTAYSDAEMLFFNSILDGEGIFGFNFKAPRTIDEKFTSETINSLITKGILNDDGSISDVAPNPAILLDFYKKSKYHIFVSGFRLALFDKRDLVGIKATDEGYEIFSCGTISFVNELIRNTNVLAESTIIGFESDWTDTNVEEYKSDMKSDDFTGCMILKKYDKHNLKVDETYLWNEEDIVCHDGIRMKKSHVQSDNTGSHIKVLFEV